LTQFLKLFFHSTRLKIFRDAIRFSMVEENILFRVVLFSMTLRSV
jgi:hypothetical protein